MRLILTAAMLLTLTSGAAAKDKLPNAEKPAMEKRVCQSHDVIMSHIPVTVCHTAKEWAEISERNKRNTGDFSDARRSNNVQPAGGIGGGS